MKRNSLEAYYPEAISALRVLLCAVDDCCDIHAESGIKDPVGETLGELTRRILVYPHSHDAHVELFEALGLVLDSIQKLEEHRDAEREREAN